jgi:hypothetical protein
MLRLRLDDYDWAEVERTKRFIAGLFGGPAPDRPAAIVHPANVPGADPAPPPGLTEFERQAWQAAAALRRRSLGGDDFVPTVGTSVSTSALATAFGAKEEIRSGVHWVMPCIGNLSEIDRLRKPPVTAGRLGEVLERTRACLDVTDERLPIRVMDFQSPFTTVEQLVGCDRFFTMPYDDPPRLKALMDLVTDFCIEFFRAQREAAGERCCPGIWPPIWFPPRAGIQMSDDHLANVSPAVYEEFVVPYNSRVAEAFGGLFLHSCTIPARHLGALKKIRGLTGLNCDISSSVPVGRLLEEFGRDIVVAPHAYINTGAKYSGYAEFFADMLAPWRPGHRFFVYPCMVLYLPRESREVAFDEAVARAALEQIRSWKRDRGR